MDVLVLGRTIGTASRWDEVDDQVVTFDNFVPRSELTTLRPTNDKECLMVDFEKGTLSYLDGDGNEADGCDLVLLLKDVDRDPPKEHDFAEDEEEGDFGDGEPSDEPEKPR